MFTGIIEGLGTVTAMQSFGHGQRFTFEADFLLDRVKIGDSIAVNGACLTVITINGNSFSADLSPETLSKSTFGASKTGERVNLERAMRLDSRLDGHFVSGHIDGVGLIRQKRITSNAVIITIETPPAISRYMIKKGSVAVDGVSLTINECRRNNFTVSIIPHTAQITTLTDKKKGDRVNIETDMIGKYVERFVILRDNEAGQDPVAKSGIDREMLAKAGFL
ncbi:riboflavin synthase [Desulfococcaceae bacterium HSG9]|nr:riboflavin synthase [Desulfococcaceae bacterium HSG9]